MEYRTIRNLGPGNDQWNHLYEMSKDGSQVRIIDKNRADHSKNIIKNDRGLLKSKDGLEKSFTAKTLYRRSWNKSFPGAEVVVKKPKKDKVPTEAQRLRAVAKAAKLAAKAERAKRRELKSAFKTKKGKLLSKFNHERLLNEIAYAKKKNHSMIQIYDKKIFLKSVISKGDVHLLRIEVQSAARTGRFFYNIKTEKYVAFNEEIHKPGYGDKSIKWPKLTA